MGLGGEGGRKPHTIPPRARGAVGTEKGVGGGVAPLWVDRQEGSKGMKG